MNEEQSRRARTGPSSARKTGDLADSLHVEAAGVPRYAVESMPVALSATVQQSSAFEGAVVQLRAAVTARTEDLTGVHRAAERGTAGPGGTLPHLDRIQRSFGGHDVRGVQAHVGGAAADASRAMGARAYASGDRVAFESAPDLHTAAHEAAHVVQQRAGVSLSGGVGRVGDRYERHADAVADAVVSGASAETLLGGASGPAGGAGAKALQRRGAEPSRTGARAVQLEEGTDAVPSLDTELDAWVTEMTGAVARIQSVWYQLHADLRTDMASIVAANEAINSEARLPVERRLQELEAQAAGDSATANQVALHRADWERRFTAVLNLQTYQGELLNGAIRVPTLVGGSTQSHQTSAFGRIVEVAGAYWAIRVHYSVAGARTQAQALSGNAFIFLRALLERTGPGSLQCLQSGTGDGVVDRMPPRTAWDALFPEAGESIHLTAEARAEAGGEDAGVSDERRQVVQRLAEMAAGIGNDWRWYAGGSGQIPSSQLTLLRETLETNAERDLFFALLDERGAYDPFMTAIPDTLRDDLLAGSGRTEPVDLEALRNQAMWEALADVGRNFAPATMEIIGGFYRGFGDTLDGIGLGFLGDVMKSAGDSFDDLAAELDRWAGNTDTNLRSTIAHITGAVEARLFQALVEGPMGGVHALVALGGGAADAMSTGQRVMGMMVRAGTWLSDGTDRVWRIRRVASGVLATTVSGLDDLMREGKSADEVVATTLGEIVSQLGGLFVELPTDADARHSEQDGRDGDTALAYMALGESRYEQRVAGANRRLEDAAREYDIAATACAGTDDRGRPLDTPTRVRRLQRAGENLARVQGEVETELAGAGRDLEASYQGLRQTQQTVAERPSDDGVSEELGQLMRGLWGKIVEVAQAALTKLVQTLIEELFTYAYAENPGALPNLGRAVGEAVKEVADKSWDETADPIVKQIIDWVGDLVGRASDLAEIGAEALLEALWEKFGGDLKKKIIDEKLQPVWDGIADEVQRELESRTGLGRGQDRDARSAQPVSG